MLRCILEKFYAFNLHLHLLFIYIKQAYDSINTTQSYKTLKEFWISKKLVNLIKMTLQDSNGKVKIQGRMTKALGRQGNATSTALFNIVLQKVIGNIEINMNGTIFKRARQYIAYADDMLILGRSVRATEVTVTQIKEDAVSSGLEINESNT